MIIELNNKERPKAEILNINLERGQIDFRWLEADETPSNVYSGVCMTTYDNQKIISIPAAEEVKEAVEKEMVTDEVKNSI